MYEFEHPSVDGLTLIFNRLKTGGHFTDNTALLEIAQFLSEYGGLVYYSKDAFEFLDNHNFDYNTIGQYKGDVLNTTLMNYALEYQYDDLIIKLHGVYGVQFPQDALQQVMTGHGFGWELSDYSNIIRYMKTNGYNIVKQNEYPLIGGDLVSFDNLHENVRRELSA